MAKGSKTGKRYSDAEKAKILKFVEAQGRGGITAAKAKYGVSYIALKRWMDGTAKGTKKGRKVPRNTGINKKSGTGIKGLKGTISMVRKLLTRLEALK